MTALIAQVTNALRRAAQRAGGHEESASTHPIPVYARNRCYVASSAKYCVMLDEYESESASRANSAGRDAGFAQIVVLAALAVISAILTVALAAASTNDRFLTVFDRRVRAEVAADSSIREILSAIGDTADTAEQELLKGQVDLAIGQMSIELRIEGEAGKIDPLLTNPDVLGGYLDDLGVGGAERAELITAIEVARGADDDGAALNVLRRTLVDRIPPGEFDSDFTHFGRGAGIDPQYASSRVLRAPPDISDAAAADIEQRRGDDVASIGTLSRYFGSASTIFSVVASVSTGDRGGYVKRVPIEITTGGRAIPLTGFR